VRNTTLLACAISMTVVATVTSETASSPLAHRLAAALSAAKLDAIAAPDPADPDRFVAALFFPGSQLLVVTARYPAPDLLKREIEHKNYREVYAALHGASVAETKFFVQDIGADGLHTESNASVDVIYENASHQTVFNGAPAEQGLSKAEYRKKLDEADQRYAHMLQLLLDEVPPAPSAP
jgi:hypothetical protein